MLDDKIKLIYNYLYDLKSKECLDYYKIHINKINLNDIKYSIPDYSNSDKENIEEYENLVKEIVESKYKYNEYDNINKRLILKRYSDSYSTTLKISFYKKDNEYILDDPINNDSLFSYLLSELVLAKKTNHILLPVINIDIPTKNIKKMLESVNEDDITDVACIQIREHFFKIKNLDEYLSENVCNIKALLFQVIHTIAILQNEYNGFRHNNLTLNNILIYMKKDINIHSTYIGFKGSEDKFYIPNIGIEIKITNFEKSIIPKHFGTKNETTSPYYDLYIFLTDLLKKNRYRKSM